MARSLTPFSTYQNVIDDALRQLGVQGDGRGWITTGRNLVPNGGFEVDASGWGAQAAGGPPHSVTTRVTVNPMFGAACLQVDTDGASGEQGAYISPNIVVVPTAPYTFSVYVRGNVGGEQLRFLFREMAGDGVTIVRDTRRDFVVTANWQRFSITVTSLSTTASVQLYVFTSTVAAVRYFIDGAQLESGTAATDYIDTNGSVTSRSFFIPDGSFGIWPAATNLVANGGFETDATGVSSWNTPTSWARDNTHAKFGSWAIKVVPGPTINCGILINVSGLSASTTYTFSYWVYGDSGNVSGDVESPFGTFAAYFPSLTLAGQWVRQTCTFTTPAGATTARVIIQSGLIGGGGVAPPAFWIDGVQLEAGSFATPYVETNGATATRAAARVSAPANLLNGSQGWAAFRFRPGWSTTSVPSPVPLLLNLQQGAQYLQVYYDGANWAIYRQDGSVLRSARVAFSVVAGTPITVVTAWTPTSVGISVNGGAFATTTFAAQASIATAAFDLGSVGGTSNFQSGDLCRFACGTGTLTDADAASIHSRWASGGTTAQLADLPHSLAA